jgi:hypothetical protein
VFVLHKIARLDNLRSLKVALQSPPGRFGRNPVVNCLLLPRHLTELTLDGRRSDLTLHMYCQTLAPVIASLSSLKRLELLRFNFVGFNRLCSALSSLTALTLLAIEKGHESPPVDDPAVTSLSTSLPRLTDLVLLHLDQCFSLKHIEDVGSALSALQALTSFHISFYTKAEDEEEAELAEQRVRGALQHVSDVELHEFANYYEWDSQGEEEDFDEEDDGFDDGFDGYF